ncbi:DEAD/DEAH box helicase [Membranihabitans maritimus]|uniref:DEAD/DEAH box helicase n=1 Tax=Membranihabitans maritimus TaxID=2904244 RepID=UPI001F017212|nr:DEAD/DEAH box helicase [Membranihabitans maritimus]
MTFKDLHISTPILKALEIQGYSTPTEIQERSIPILLEGKDLLGCAQTGTGKTAAFSIPIIQQLSSPEKNSKGKRKIKCLIVTPTRELALQIVENIRAYSKFTNLNSTVIFGGVKQKSQTDALRRGIDILVATPGRLLDLIGQGFINLDDIEHFVLDEADQMLDMGFIHDIKKIIAKLPAKRQSLFFSATMSKEIVELSKRILGNPEKITINPEQTTAEKVKQELFFVHKKDKIKLLIDLLKKDNTDTVLVFSRTKHGANKIVKKLDRASIKAEAIHGNKSQNSRQRALKNFKTGRTKVLVATDIAARGIDVDELSHVINYDLPNVAETYVHRIGRTGRAGASGTAFSFCAADERPYLKDIQKLIKQELPVVEEHPYVDDGKAVENENNDNQNRSENNFTRKRSNNSRRNFHRKNKQRTNRQKNQRTN